MFKKVNTYRRFLFALLLLSYVFSVFQKPIFEGLHLLSHAPAIVFANENVHSYESHDLMNHQHQSLAKWEVLNNENDHQPYSQSEQEIKKKIEIVDNVSSTSSQIVQQFVNHFHLDLPVFSAFIKIPNPPPQLS